MAKIEQPEDTLRSDLASHDGQTVEVINIKDLNILEQPRDRFDGIDELAESIKANGLLSPISVARNNPRLTREYAQLVNKIWRRPAGSAFDLKDLHAIHDHKPKSYLILIAGECRTRAFVSLGRTEIPAFIYDDLDPKRILKIQLTENIRKRRPPLPREAQAIVGLYNLERLDNQALTKRSFCNEVGIGSDQLLIYQRIFMDVPDAVREAFEKGLISLGIAREFWNLWYTNQEEDRNLQAFNGIEGFEAWLSGEILDQVIKDKKLSIAGARELIWKKFWSIASRQGDFSFEIPKGDNFLERTLRKFGGEMTALFSCLSTILRVYQEGKYPILCSPFTDQSLRKLFTQVLELLEQLGPHLEMLTTAQRQLLIDLVAKLKGQLENVETLQHAIQLCDELGRP